VAIVATGVDALAVIPAGVTASSPSFLFHLYFGVAAEAGVELEALCVAGVEAVFLPCPRLLPSLAVASPGGLGGLPDHCFCPPCLVASLSCFLFLHEAATLEFPSRGVPSLEFEFEPEPLPVFLALRWFLPLPELLEPPTRVLGVNASEGIAPSEGVIVFFHESGSCTRNSPGCHF